MNKETVCICYKVVTMSGEERSRVRPLEVPGGGGGWLRFQLGSPGGLD